MKRLGARRGGTPGQKAQKGGSQTDSALSGAHASSTPAPRPWDKMSSDMHHSFAMPTATIEVEFGNGLKTKLLIWHFEVMHLTVNIFK
ncbi:hypothetical protein AVME950_16650 [Acidovorax sp. SUPP950]|uniref:hypothetical protein n=1 Tax=Acidovorax sp. SUPP950 TaxID=511901 RepID=UPI0023C21EC2|nr:hypothetical protein [Acidovorax sp. SUPP950]GKS76548.1 hypothetical protein AVME950_16650 [Acidovorax sp. SUPP950]